MCREEATKASAHFAEFRAAGATRIVAILKEDLKDEVHEFREQFWKEEVMLDEKQAFYKALGGGDVHKTHTTCSFLCMMLNPFNKHKTKKNIKRSSVSGVQGNLSGEGFIQGGCYVLRSDGTAAFSFLEDSIGDHAEVSDIIAALKDASKSV
eukprot:TRINITY_DN25858_c0_g1_i1.p1 TRINITY_DN25858_c0_g1~~TRINITY_DN25858_c0_g1_i1.p1  ORF type:complete len:152 (-),score=44.13 TRINITY_DN25858_c0_g1_i1:57-512(-)